MHTHFYDKLLRLKLFGCRGAIDKLRSIFALFDSFLLKKVLKCRKVGHVASHVCREDDADHSLAEGLEVVSRVFFHKVEFRLIHDSLRFCYVVVFLNGFVTVPDGAFANCIHMVGVVEAIMTVIVAHS